MPRRLNGWLPHINHLFTLANRGATAYTFSIPKKLEVALIIIPNTIAAIMVCPKSQAACR